MSGLQRMFVLTAQSETTETFLEIQMIRGIVLKEKGRIRMEKTPFNVKQIK